MRDGGNRRRWWCRDRRLADRGFTLLELLVAVAVLAALVTLIPRSFVSARSAIDRSEDWLEARLVAAAVLNGELARRDLTPGTLRGTSEGRRWTAVLVPSRIGRASEETDRTLLDVRLTVAVSGTAALDVETMRIGSAR